MAIIGSSPLLLRAIDLADLFAPHNVPIILSGENGTGKELFAQRIHQSSGRTGPLITVNCGALPESLVESVLFGHAKGAFTDAKTAHCGRFEMAQDGTIFLDEVGELPLQAQVKLLRVLESSEITPVGSNTTKKLNVRVVAATNRDLLAMVEGRSFREDLYWRLRGLNIRLPPLRERGADVITLAEYFRSSLAPEKVFSEEVKELLQRHSWTGNVRELRTEILAASIIARNSRLIEVEHFLLKEKMTAQGSSPAVTTVTAVIGEDLRNDDEEDSGVLEKEAAIDETSTGQDRVESEDVEVKAEEASTTSSPTVTKKPKFEGLKYNGSAIAYLIFEAFAKAKIDVLSHKDVASWISDHYDYRLVSPQFINVCSKHLKGIIQRVGSGRYSLTEEGIETALKLFVEDSPAAPAKKLW